MPLQKRVWDVMDPNFQTVTPETPLREASAILGSQEREKQGSLGLVVMRTSGEFLGLLTTKEVLKYVIYLYNKSKREGKEEDWSAPLSDHGKDGSLVTVNDVLVFHEVFARPSQTLFEVIQIMEENDLEIVPVVDSGRVIGVIHSADILGEIARNIQVKHRY